MANAAVPQPIPLNGAVIREIEHIMAQSEAIDPGECGGFTNVINIAKGDTATTGEAWNWLLNPIARLSLFWLFSKNRAKSIKRENKFQTSVFVNAPQLTHIKEEILASYAVILDGIPDDLLNKMQNLCDPVGSYLLPIQANLRILRIIAIHLGKMETSGAASDMEIRIALNLDVGRENLVGNQLNGNFEWREPTRRIFTAVQSPGNTPIEDPIIPPINPVDPVDPPVNPADPPVDDPEQEEEDYFSMESKFNRALHSLATIQEPTDHSISAFTLRSNGPETDLAPLQLADFTFQDMCAGAMGSKSLKAPAYRAVLRMLTTFLHKSIMKESPVKNRGQIPCSGPETGVIINMHALSEANSNLKFVISLANDRILTKFDEASREAFGALCMIFEGAEPFPSVEKIRSLWAESLPECLGPILHLATSFCIADVCPSAGLTKTVVLPPGTEKFHEKLRSAASILKGTTSNRTPLTLTDTWAKAKDKVALMKLPGTLSSLIDAAEMQLDLGSIGDICLNQDDINIVTTLTAKELAFVLYSQRKALSLVDAMTVKEKLEGFAQVFTDLENKDYTTIATVLIKSALATTDLESFVLKISQLLQLHPDYVSKKKRASYDENSNYGSYGATAKKKKTSTAPAKEKDNDKGEYIPMIGRKVAGAWKKAATALGLLTEEKRAVVLDIFKEHELSFDATKARADASKATCSFSLCGETCPYSEGQCRKKHLKENEKNIVTVCSEQS